MGRGCLQVIGGFVVLAILAGVIAGVTSKSSNNGTTISLSNTGATTQSVPSSAPEPGPFNGADTQNVGTITVPDNTVLHWTCAACGGSNGSNFIVSNNFSDASEIAVNSLDEGSGQTVVDGGTYHDVQVEGSGSWTLTFVHG